MITVRNILLICILNFFVVFSLFAEVSLSIGYNGAVFGNGVSNIRSEVYRLNHNTYPNLKNPFTFHNYFQGAQVDLIFGSREKHEFYYFMSWTNQFNLIHGSGTYNGSDFSMSLIYRQNNFTFTGFGFALSDKFSVCLSPVNIGRFKVYSKNSASAEPDKWKPYHNVDDGIISSYLNFGSSVNLDYNIKPRWRFRLQGYYDWYGVQLRSASDILFVYNYRATSISASIAYVIPVKD